MTYYIIFVYFQKYYFVVNATTSVGTVSAMSDGIMVVDQSADLSGIEIRDGEPCNAKGSGDEAKRTIISFHLCWFIDDWSGLYTTRRVCCSADRARWADRLENVMLVSRAFRTALCIIHTIPLTVILKRWCRVWLRV
jgi:hypothetical protein